MKRLFSLLLLIPLFCFGQTWTSKKDIPGGARRNTVGFVLDGYGYICMGGVGSSINSTHYSDLYRYNQATDSWATMNAYPAAARRGGIACATDSFAYVGMGWDNRTTYYDIQRYNPRTDSWDTIPSYPGNGGREPFAQTHNDDVFVGGGVYGTTSYYQDFWKFSADSNKWTQRADLPFGRRANMVSFSSGGKIYAGMGNSSGSAIHKDFWEYDIQSNTWTQLADLPGSIRMSAFHFELNGKFIVGGGNSLTPFGSKIYHDDYFEYDPATDQWVTLGTDSMADISRAAYFVINNKGYIATGYRNGGNVKSLIELSISPAVDSSCVADFSYSIDSSNTVHFTAANMGVGYQYSWDFGDQNSDTTSNPSHSYAGSGTYVVSLTVVNGIGDTCTVTDSVLVNTCSSSFSYLIGKDGEVSFFSHAVSSPNGTAYSWTFGDGNSSTEEDPVHTFSASGTYNVTLSINDTINTCTSSWSSDVVVIVNDSNCTASFIIEKDSSTQYNIILYNTSTNASTHSYLWDFGDGTTASGRTPIHTYQSFGLYEVCLTVSDTVLGCDTAVFCDTVGMDSLGNLKAGFGLEVRDRVLVGVEQEEDPFESLIVYPNPSADGRFILKSTAIAEENLVYSVYDMTGRSIMEQLPFNRSNDNILDLSGKPSGMYLLRIVGSDKQKTVRLMVN